MTLNRILTTLAEIVDGLGAEEPPRRHAPRMPVRRAGDYPVAQLGLTADAAFDLERIRRRRKSWKIHHTFLGAGVWIYSGTGAAAAVLGVLVFGLTPNLVNLPMLFAGGGVVTAGFWAATYQKFDDMWEQRHLIRGEWGWQHRAELAFHDDTQIRYCARQYLEEGGRQADAGIGDRFAWTLYTTGNYQTAAELQAAVAAVCLADDRESGSKTAK